MEVAIMIEGQNGLNWPRWQGIARAVEALGFAGLYRSDHFTNAGPPELDSLELWLSLAWLAGNTRRIQFGQLVSPVSFRHPVFLARMGAQLDDLSGGRMRLGVGAGWQTREHEMFGFDLLDLPARMDRLAEAVQVISALLRGPEPVTLQGKYYRLREAVLLPRPARPGGPPLVIGGNGPRRTLPLAARFADEWNAMFLTPQAFRQRAARLDALLQAAGRLPAHVRRSMMTGLVFGRDDADVGHKLAARGRTAGELRQRGLVVGVPSEVVEQVGRLARAGLEKIVLQWLDLDDLDGLEVFAFRVLSQL